MKSAIFVYIALMSANLAMAGNGRDYSDKPSNVTFENECRENIKSSMGTTIQLSDKIGGPIIVEKRDADGEVQGIKTIETYNIQVINNKTTITAPELKIEYVPHDKLSEAESAMLHSEPSTPHQYENRYVVKETIQNFAFNRRGYKLFVPVVTMSLYCVISAADGE